ncbi:MAG: D-aminoacyl-tRNA deacylase [archaeon]
MRFAIAYYKDNIAGKNIVERFKKLGFNPQVPIIELKKETIYSEGFDKKYPELKNVDFIVFASTHKSEKKFPSLCLHAPGNWRGNDLGGQAGKVCNTSAYVLKYLFKEFEKNFNKTKKELNEEYNLTLEVTHHGPLIDMPCCFIELGSNEKQWTDKKAADIVAKTILSLQDLDKKKFEEWIPCIGIGGPHYAPNFTKIQLNSNYAIGHIIPEYGLPLSDVMLKEAEEKTLEQVKEILVDWKGCGKSEQRQQVVDIIKKSGLKYTRTKAVEK